MDFKEWTSKWLEVYKRHNLKEKTYGIYRDVLYNHLYPTFAEKMMSAITTEDILVFVSMKKKEGNMKGGGLANNTVNLIITVLKSIFSDACDMEIINRNPMRMVKKLKKDEKKVVSFSLKDQMKIEQYCLEKNNSQTLGIIICFYTGLRIGELLALTWDDIDLKSGLLFVDKTVSKVKVMDEWKVITTAPKTETSKRVIPLSHKVILLLKKMYKKRIGKYLITTRDGGQVSTRAYQCFFFRLQRRLCLEPLNFHAIRHTFATRAIESGMDVKALSEILGHSDAAITLNRYVHSFMATKKKAMEKLSKMINIS